MVRITKIPQRLACVLDDLIDFKNKSSAVVEEGLPIIITGAPRSATTTLEEIFNSNSVFLHHEPFIKNTLLWKKQSEIKTDSAIYDKAVITSIHQSILSGKSWSNYRKAGRWYPYVTKMALHKSLPLKPRRVIIKDPGISFCLDEIAPLLGEHIGIIFMRNPLSIVTSLKRLNWDPIQRLELIYTHPYFKRFDIHKANISLDKIRVMQPIERMALQTSLLHHFMRKHAEQLPNYSIVYMESLFSNPFSNISELSNKLGFSANYIKETHIAAITTRDIHPITKHSFKRQSSQYIKYWENKITNEECAIINNYYSLFNNPYQQ
ncbi:MAG: sulfotransferase [Chitinophagales bacterium]|jgi:hypothetical protein|nr:sulfotransferase [Bacteroidota bacterium]MBK9504829.1 sulfotransferase [Bacteroidota bacterium]MBK9555837.1 sulfotransferase [Bacteroidota bacterium]MBL0279394.1 sulfotransferase [Bacteroidota bacterium]MBP9878530.1 sulfotransferase [Chitinophagales bacterium]